jgi:hypothetical protein
MWTEGSCFNNDNPGSMVPLVSFSTHPVTQAPWRYLSDAVLTGAHPFTIVHGKVTRILSTAHQVIWHQLPWNDLQA